MNSHARPGLEFVRLLSTPLADVHGQKFANISEHPQSDVKVTGAVCSFPSRCPLLSGAFHLTQDR